MAKLSTRISEWPVVKLAYLASQLRSKKELLAAEPIAVVGMSCRFPGGGELPETFWEMLAAGRDTTREVPSSRWDVDAFYDPTPGVPGKMYTRRGAFIDDVDLFDPGFFGITPRDAKGMDPQQRMLLEECWRALERAGIPPAGLAGSRTGLFLGLMHNDYNLLGITEDMEFHSASLNYPSVAAGRISHTLGLQGPAVSVDTACSSSAVAIHLACQSLRNDESDLALAAGVNLNLSPVTVMVECQNRMLAADGRCKTFDASADGFGRGEGCGVVVLKRLSDALAQGDSIIGVIRGSAVTHDGRSSGLMVPNGRSQERVIRAALESCGVEPDQVGYIEAHGTGTLLGDPIEMEALRSVFGRKGARGEPLYVGSVKTNIGHLEAAAGIAGLIKVLLSLQNEAIPAHLNFERPNPNIRWDDLPVTVPTATRPWLRGEKRRIAGVSSFGFSGTNVHLVVEEAPVLSRPRPEHERPVHVLALSAKSEAALEALMEAQERALPEDASALGDWCYTANAGRSQFEHRAAVSGATAAELRANLARLREEKLRPEREPLRGTERPRPVFLFTGQGALRPGVGRELYETQPVFRAALERCSKALDGLLDCKLEALLFGDTSATLLEDTRHAQPALVALEFALAELWASWGVTPSALIGHSLGEYAAAAVAGVFSIEEALRLVVTRARLIGDLLGAGAMLAVSAPLDTVRAAIAPHAGAVSLAAINGPEDVVVSGAPEAITEVEAALGRQGLQTKRLRMTHAFHSTQMEPVLKPFAEAFQGVTLAAPRIPLVSTLEGRRVGDEIARPEYWCRQLREPVAFAQGLEALRAEGHRTYLELGPAPILAGIGRRNFQTAEELSWLPSLRPSAGETAQLLASLAELYMRGFDVDWTAFDAPFERRPRCLPTHPFLRERYWMDSKNPAGHRAYSAADATARGEAHTLPGTPLPLAGAKEARFAARLSTHAPAFIEEHRVLGNAVLPAACYVEMALGAAHHVAAPGRPLELTAIELERALVFTEGQAQDVQTVLSPEEGGSRFEIYGQATGGSDRAWSRLAQGRVIEGRARPDTVPLASGLLPEFPREGSVRALYEMMARGGLEYGPSFRGIDALRFGKEGCLAHVRLPDALVIGLGDYWLHPLLLDACFQTAAAAFTGGDAQVTGEGQGRIPIAIERLRWFKRPGSSIWVHARAGARASLAEGLASADLRILDEDGAVVAEVEGLLLKQVDRRAFQAAFSAATQELLYELAWREQPAPTARDQVATQAGSWLLLVDSEGLAREVQALARQRSWRCVVATPGTGYACVDAGHYRLDPYDAAHFDRLLQDVSADGAAPTAVACLWGMGDRSPEARSGALTASTVGALHLVKALARAPWPHRPALWMVTEGAVAATPTDAVEGFAQAALWGFGRAAAIEHTELACRMVDLEPGAEALERLFHLMAQPPQENVMAVRGGRLLGARLVRPGKPPGGTAPVRIQPEGVYLVTGGLGALGLATAEWLVGAGARHLLLVGRGGPSDAANKRLAALTARGADITVARADVSRLEDVQRLVAGVAERGQHLRGVIHTAGVLEDGVILHQDRERFSRVFAPKVRGALNLHRATVGLPLDLFVMYSSAASLVGVAGQSNYVAANSVLDALAHHRRHQGLPALSLNWGRWAGAGMAAKSAEASDAASLAPEVALQVLEQLLEQGAVQMGVVPFSVSSLESGPSPGHGPLFSELMLREQARSAGASRLQELVDELKRADGERRRVLLTRYVQSRLGPLLGFAPDHEVLQKKISLNEMGLDSLRAVELKNRIGRELGVDLLMARFIDGTTLDGIVDALSNQLELKELLARAPAAEAAAEIEELTV
ncbi:type I polyketide synthase [Corallococcus macrosporus]|uniref:Polyketide synthase n=1 Tax=Myxococcus fulvus (strain ATCC BAA-855 / HW-1) TaxID=483219 RepID=F8CN02_MYXFH|nr:type I polyketide synthase [Corallococcus macrosporus]AEI67808.1 polyketide synthase [Corallococcus macrosporus]